MKGVLCINKITLNQKHLNEVFAFLRETGKNNVEGIALFAGIIHGNVFEEKAVIIPKQTGYILEEGLTYAVENEELHSINVWLYENKMQLIAQIHSHPSTAYHSSTDDRYPIVDTYGGISIVVPDFAINIFTLDKCAIYRLSLKKTWDKLTSTETKTLFQIV